MIGAFYNRPKGAGLRATAASRGAGWGGSARALHLSGAMLRISMWSALALSALCAGLALSDEVLRGFTGLAQLGFWTFGVLFLALAFFVRLQRRELEEKVHELAEKAAEVDRVAPTGEADAPRPPHVV